MKQAPIILLMCFASAIVAIGVTALIISPHQFYDREGNTLPYHAVDSLVNNQFTRVSPEGMDTLIKYFNHD